ERPWVLSKYCEREPRVTLSQIPELRRLCDSYGRSLREAGYAETLDAVPYAFATIGQQPVGTHLTHSMRRMYRDAWLRAERLRQPSPPHAFGADLGRGFREWLTAPANIAEQVTGLNRLAMAVWRRRPDLQGAFPRPTGTDAAAFREWCHTSGLTEHELTPWALPTEPDPVAEPIDDFGVNVLGYLTAELGIGEMGRIVLRAVELADVPVVSVVEDEELLNRTNIAPPRNLGTPRFGVSLLAVNADQTSVMLDRHPAMAASRYRIGLWAWELEEFPDEFHSAFDLVDEVWTVSAFCAKAIAAHSPVPVYAIPVPVPDPGLIPRAGATRNSPPQFLFMFDFNSIIGRKNPYGLIEAFSRAFDDGDDARLVIKAINGERHPQAAEKLRLRIAEDRRIELIEDYLPIDQLDQLYRDSDCYVSLHRSEGFGLTVAEAMIRALPVIATDYSGTTEFLDESTGWPVPYAMTTVGGDDEPYPEGARWAEPDLDAAAEAMREVVDDPSEAMRRGAAARAHLLANRSMAEAGHWLADRLSAAHDDWLTRRSAGAPAAHSGPPDPVAAVRNASEALRWRPNPGTASRSPISPAVRRLTLRAIDHYDVHQRSVMRALLDGVTEGMQRVTDRLDAMEGRLAETERRALRSWTVNTEILRDVGNLEFETHTLRSELAKEAAQRAHAIRTEIEPLREYTDGALDAVRAHTHAMFADRDRRSDAEEAEFAGLAHDVAGLYTAARMAHAPVPSDADIAVCDAGVLLLPRDRVMLPWLRHHGSWERAEADLMAEIAGDGTFLDVGAHVGYHTLRLLGRSPQTPRVVAVEANPDTVPLLRRNIAVNLPSDVAGHVTVLAVAAWDSEGKVRLVHVEADNSGDHRVSQGGIGGVTVPALRLDGVSEVASERVSLVKVDLQGRDHRALDGLATVLRRDRPHVVCEFSPEPITEFGDDPAKVLAGYRDLGYRIALAGDRSEPEDAELVRQAETAATGFITLWLRPS
ncbi:MAG: FkbM family methyltransferase, partial [Sciscionella sp.]